MEVRNIRNKSLINVGMQIPSPELIELTYVSQPAEEMSFLGLMRLLYHSYLRNQALGITGVLIFEDQRFGQVIEGPAHSINRLWDKIQKDERHKNVKLINRKIIERRSFLKWTMIFQGNEEIANRLPEVKAAIDQGDFPSDHPLLVALRNEIQR
jgi:hypothetical protein